MGKFRTKKTNRIICLGCNLLNKLQYTEFNGGGQFFYFQQEAIFFGKFDPQNQNTSLS